MYSQAPEQCYMQNNICRKNFATPSSLSVMEQAQLLKRQYRQLYKRQYQSIKKKDKCLRFTFPITYPCPMKFKRRRSSVISNSSILSQLSSSSFQQSLQKQMNNQLSNTMNRLRSAVSISFIDDKSGDISINKIPKKPHSSSLLNNPSKNISTNKTRSFNAYLGQHICQLCGSILSNGICSCIVQYLLKLNKTKENDILVQLNDIFENLTSNNIIT
ncbi:unnamed protein product [Rotaria sp. Silwood1]|nr:unnamed protein product [Rotaria sp. Silwood1]CAF0854379.1 unnamed protein product [Rotaria sp. Silwood1]CAF3378278.1 unnamed protein product [Rotaria sp. Silwood1]CAF3380988.1 unnamed protein product [Rotaria sp. Silwood1]CAF4650360.1 unnamed protein product [Rotaria sp. Silwood1]